MSRAYYKSSYSSVLSRLLRALCIAMSALILMGCASLMKPHAGSPPVPANLLQPCPDLDPLTGNTGADVIETMLSWAATYNDCRDGKAALIKAIKNSN